MSLPNTYTLSLQRHRTSTVGLKYCSTLASKLPNAALNTRMLSTRTQDPPTVSGVKNRAVALAHYFQMQIIKNFPSYGPAI
jgi:hypothetical protein